MIYSKNLEIFIGIKTKNPVIDINYRILKSLMICGTSWNRTSDTRIFSPLLYQLSYGTPWLGLQM